MRINEIITEDASPNRLWAQITAYEKQAKATSNDIKKQHLLRMADDLRAKLPTSESVVDEAPASRSLCQSGKPDSALGASQLASCKSQGYRSRDGGKSHKVGSERVKVRGKKIKGKKYGGPLPDWS